MADDTEKVVIERPQHPLPDEINQLSEEETQCKFCGISYLIHREVARLKDDLAKAQKEVEKMADDISRYNELKSELDQTIKTQKETEVKLNGEKLERSTINRLYEDIKKQNETQIVLHREEKEKVKEKLVDFISQHREEVESLKQNLLDFKSTSNDLIKKKTTVLIEQFTVSNKKLDDKHKDEIEALSKKLTESSEKNAQITNENILLEKELDRVKSDLEYVSNSNNQNGDKLKTTTAELDASLAHSKTLKAEFLRKVGEITQLNERLAESSAAQSTAESTSKRLSGDYEGMKLRLNAEISNIRLKNDQLESELKNFQMELLEKDELLQTSVRLSDFEKIKDEQESSTQHIKALENQINETLNQLNELKIKSNNQEQTYLANTQSMEADFKAEIGRYQLELDSIKMRNINTSQLDELESNLEIEKEKSRAAIEMARLEISQAEERFRQVLSEKDEQLEKSRRLHQQQQDEQDQSIGSLRAQIRESEIREQEQNQEISEMRSKLEQMEQTSQSSRETLGKEQSALYEQLNSKEEQINQLSNTIRKQIEERMELQSTIEQLKNKGDGEVIMLPIAARLKAASLPPIEQRRKVSPQKAWGGSSTTSQEDSIRKSTSAPTIKKTNTRTKSSNLNISSIRKRLNLAMNRS